MSAAEIRRAAHRRGRRAARTSATWDDALSRFSRRRCGHGPATTCPLCLAFCEGFDGARLTPGEPA